MFLSMSTYECTIIYTLSNVLLYRPWHTLGLSIAEAYETLPCSHDQLMALHIVHLKA